ncbi:MFS family permease [Halanaeroarchaeum sp. HSR-CO]|uniref:MFS transporter n=1 Tax=Halanaeroarchaeum sp. HSR-CO TaxID=2866382 RepID=UPI00217EDE31|nr:MFS transporter [Halanaeroarchaeum sp. HSR-CO]UWG46336.1 MFS family permease [Halanaeroarchaeum sp. HSR-CO]
MTTIRDITRVWHKLGHREHVFFWVTLGLAITKTGRSLLPPLLPAIVTDLQISSTMAGIALSLSAIFYALHQYPGGHLSDTLSRKTILVAGLGVVAVGGVTFLTTNTLLGFVVGAAILGAGVGIYGPADRAQVTELFTERRGLAFGFNTSATDIGGVAATVIATGAIGYGAWRLAYGPVVIGAVLIAVLLVALIRHPLRAGTIGFPIRGTATRIYGTSAVRNVIAAYALFNIVVQGVIGFLPTLLHVEYGYSLALATQLFGLVYAVGLVVRPIAGRISDTVARPVVATAGLAVAGMGIVVIVSSPSLPVVVGGVTLFAIGQKAFPPVMQAYLMDGFPVGSMGGDLGLSRTTYIGIGSIGPALVGYTASITTYRFAFAGLLVAILLATVIIVATDTGG